MSTARQPLRPAYLLWGEDRATIDRWLQRLARRVADEGGMAPERLSAPDTPAEEVVAVCQALSFGGTRLVIVDGLDAWSRAEHVGPLVEYLAAPNPATCLALVSGPPAHAAVAAAVAALAAPQAPTVHQLGPDPKAKAGDRQRWLADHFAREARRLGLDVPPAIARQVVELVCVDRAEAHREGHNALNLTREAEKLAAYAAGRPVTAEMVAQVVPAHPDARSYALADAIVAGDAATVHRLLADLAGGSDPAPPIVVQSALARHFRALAAARRAGARPSPGAVTAATGIGGYPAQKLAEQASRVSARGAQAAAARVADLELELRVSEYARLGRGSDDGSRFVLELAARDLMGLLAPAAA